MKRKILIAIYVVAMLSGGYAEARDVKFEASVDNNTIALGERAQLGLTFYGTQAIPAPDIGNIDGFEVRYIGPSTMMTVLNGKMSSSVTHMYTIFPLKIGKFQIGPFSFKYKSDNYTSNMVFVEVAEEKPIKVEREEGMTVDKLNLADRLFVTLSAGKTRAFVNELIPVTVKFYVRALNVSDIQLPVFEQEGFSKIEFKEPKQYREELGGILYDVLEFKTHIFGTRPGEYTLGPAKIKCNLVVKKKLKKSRSRIDDFFGDEPFDDPYFDNFFTKYERYPLELKTEDTAIIVSPLPTEGRPQGFSGAIGDFQFIFNASPTKLKVGDPLTLRMEINGTGNFNTVVIPELEGTDGFRAYEPQIKTEANTKSFIEVLIPETEKVIQTPKAVFTYFNPIIKEYRIIAQGPIPIQVEKPKEEGPAQVIGPIPGTASQGITLGGPNDRGDLKRDIIYIKESLGRMAKKGHRLYKNKLLAAIIPLPLIGILFLYIGYVRSSRMKRDLIYSRRMAGEKSSRAGFRTLKAQLKSDDPKVFYETLFKTLQDYLGSRLGLVSAGITFDMVDPLLLSRGIDLNIRGSIRSLFEMCDKAKFAFTKMDESRMRDDFKELERVIRYFERVKL